MMDLRDKAQMGPTAASLGAMLALTAVALYMVLAPTPSVADSNRKFKRDRQKMLMDALIAKKDAEKDRAASIANLWAVPPTDIGPSALSDVTRLAKADGVTLLAFRPQKQSEFKGMTVLPFVISVQGKFDKIAKFERDLETAARKLAVNLVQIASSDSASDEVNGTIGITAFCQNPPAHPKGGETKSNG